MKEINVLLVEDHEIWKNFLTKWTNQALESIGCKFSIQVREGFNEACETFENDSYNLLVTDISLKHGHLYKNDINRLGIQLVESAKELGVPCIVVSGTPIVRTGDVKRFFKKQGACDYFSKNEPIREEYIAKVREIIKDIISQGKNSNNMDIIKRQRLQDLDEILKIEYDKLQKFQKQLAFKNDPGLKFQIEQDIQREIMPNISKYEKEYWNIFTELAMSNITENDANKAVDELQAALKSTQQGLTKAQSKDLTELLSRIENKLNQPDVLATAKLKTALPIIPGILTYELDLDLQGTLTQVWQRLRATLRH